MRREAPWERCSCFGKHSRICASISAALADFDQSFFTNRREALKGGSVGWDCVGLAAREASSLPVTGDGSPKPVQPHRRLRRTRARESKNGRLERVRMQSLAYVWFSWHTLLCSVENG